VPFFYAGLTALHQHQAMDLLDHERRIARGLALAGSGDLPAAMRLLNQAASDRPGEPHPCLDLPAMLAAAGRGHEIPVCLLAALAVRPRAPLVALALARHYREAGKMYDALRLARHAVAVGPELAAAHRLLGWIVADLGDLEASVTHSRRAVGLDPADAAAWSNLGVALTDLGRHAEGEAAHAVALRLDPDQPRIRLNRAVNLLAQGRFAEAWPDYEWRLRLPGHTALPAARLLPNLDSLASGDATPLAGKTILVTHEEGLGDSIQFARFVPLLADRGARVLAHAPPPLERLFRSLGDAITVLPSAAGVPAFDYHCPYASLPRAFGVELNTIPVPPYLFAERRLADRWRAAMPPVANGSLRVGLVWAGQARPWVEGHGALDGRRSMRLADLAPLADLAGICWISLQMGPAAQELSDPPDFIADRRMTVWDPMDRVRDFADTAAIVAGLDLVISVDTSVAHLAGALGKTVFLLDRFDTCWRWLRQRDDSPWYPSLGIFRQTGLGEWATPVSVISNILLQKAKISGITRKLC